MVSPDSYRNYPKLFPFDRLTWFWYHQVWSYQIVKSQLKKLIKFFHCFTAFTMPVMIHQFSTFLPPVMDYRANPKDNCFHEMILLAETAKSGFSSTTVDQPRFLWWKFISCSKVSRVKHFKKAFDWIWRDSLTFHYVINNDWLTYLFTLRGKNVITKHTCAPPYHTIITVSVNFYQAKCLIILHVSLFLKYCLVVFCFNLQRNA